jgi:hypothetical protein
MRRTLLLFVVLGALTLFASLPASSQDQYDPGVGEAQYAQEEVAAAGCDWYWGYRWYTAGAWEWWCWDPVMGWWYGTDESGTKQFSRTNQPGSFINVR